jgi:galactokinase
MRDQIAAAFVDAFGAPPAHIAHAPGRVNVLGEHTDYNDGYVLPCAIGAGTYAAVGPRDDGRIVAIAADFGDAMDSIDMTQPITPGAHEWANYVRGMAHYLDEAGMAPSKDNGGANLYIKGTMPKGTGLSSSASLENAVGLALATLAGHGDIDRSALAKMGQLSEHHFAGCHCGIMDQMVSAGATAAHLMMLDCRTLEPHHIAFPDDWAILIVQSGVVRGLIDGEYNARRAQCEAGAMHFGLAALRDADAAMLLTNPPADAVVAARTRHVVTENARVLSAVQALAAHDLNTLGDLLRASHRSMRNDFAITHPKVDELADRLNVLIGADGQGAGGARMTGGGFGGAVVAVLAADRAEDVAAAIARAYQTPDGLVPDIMHVRPQKGAALI